MDVFVLGYLRGKCFYYPYCDVMMLDVLGV